MMMAVKLCSNVPTLAFAINVNNYLNPVDDRTEGKLRKIDDRFENGSAAKRCLLAGVWLLDKMDVRGWGARLQVVLLHGISGRHE